MQLPEASKVDGRALSGRGWKMGGSRDKILTHVKVRRKARFSKLVVAWALRLALSRSHDQHVLTWCSGAAALLAHLVTGCNRPRQILPC